jgi:seryl-tRNA synthetase
MKKIQIIQKFNFKRNNFQQIKPRFDYKGISSKKEEYENSIKFRNLTSVDLSSAVSLYEKSISIKHQIDQFKKERNEISNSMKKERNETLIQKVKEMKETISNLEKEYETIQDDLISHFSKVPNLCSKETPLNDQPKFLFSNFLIENEDPTLQQDLIKIQKNKFNHVEIAEKLKLIDFETGSETSHPKSYYLKNDAVLLELALIQFAVQFLRKKGFDVHSTPELVKNKMIESCGLKKLRNLKSKRISTKRTSFSSLFH